MLNNSLFMQSEKGAKALSGAVLRGDWVCNELCGLLHLGYAAFFWQRITFDLCKKRVCGLRADIEHAGRLGVILPRHILIFNSCVTRHFHEKKCL